MNANLFTLVAGTLLASLTFADEVILKDGVADWTLASSYTDLEGNELAQPPPVDSTVRLTENGSWTLDLSTVAGQQNFTFVTNRFKRIMPLSKSTLIVSVPEGERAEMPCAVSMYNAPGTVNGELFVKDGAGELDLTAYGVVMNGASTFNDYYVGFWVKNGLLKLPQDDSAQANSHPGRDLTVDENGVYFAAAASAITFSKLTGSGLLTNDCAKVMGITYNSGSARQDEFSGRINGRFSISFQSGCLNLTGVQNTFGGVVQVYGNKTGTAKEKAYGLGVVTFMPDSEGRGSLGSSETTYLCNATTAGRFLYLGTGETVTKNFLDYGAPEAFVLDGGANGGLILNNKWELHTTAKFQAMHRIVLTGSNTVPCEVTGQFVANTPNDDGFTAYVAKEGTGTWRLRDNAQRKNSGVWAIRNGTLQFDSIAPKGNVCSLGRSTLLYDDVYMLKEIDEGKKVDYAFLLGTPETEGTFEYTGTAPAACYDRPLALNGKGRLKTSAGSLTLGGTYAEAVGSVLTLDGTTASTLVGASDGAKDGTLAIVKEGAGDWTLDGDTDITGPVTVRGTGTLAIHNPTHERFRYFRFTIKENACGSPDWTGDSFEGKNYQSTNSVQLLEFGLYDANGIRRNKGLANGSDWRQLQAGECAIGSDLKWVGGNAFGTAALFDDICYDGSAYHAFNYSRKADVGNPMVKGNPSGWLPVVMRLADDVPEIVSYDVCYFQHKSSSGANANPTAFMLEGSLDGQNWTLLADVPRVVPSDLKDGTPYVGGTTHCWLSNHDRVDTIGGDSVRKLSERKSFAFADAEGEPVRAIDPTDHTVRFGGLVVEPGATVAATGPEGLELSELTVDKDCENGLAGFRLAATGTLTVTGMTRAGGEITKAFTGVANLTALENWTVIVPEAPRLVLSVEDGRVWLRPSGMLLLFR